MFLTVQVTTLVLVSALGLVLYTPFTAAEGSRLLLRRSPQPLKRGAFPLATRPYRLSISQEGYLSVPLYTEIVPYGEPPAMINLDLSTDQS